MDNKTEKTEKKICGYFTLTIISLFVVNISAGLSQMTGISSSIISNFCKIILGLYFIMLLPLVIKRFNLKMLLFCFTAIIITLINILFFSAQEDVFKGTIITFFSMCLSSFLIGSIIKNFNIMKLQLLKASYIVSALAFLYLLCAIVGIAKLEYRDSYSMGLGYSMLIPALVLISKLIEKVKFIDIISLLSIVISILVYGSRGPLLGLIFFFVFYTFRYLLYNKKHIQLLIFIVVLILIILFFNNIVQLIADIASNLGIQSRSLLLFGKSNVHLSGRDFIYRTIGSEIKNNPFKIRGINADYLLVGIYSHNIALELLYEFGIVFGGLMIVAIVYYIVITLKSSKFEAKNEIATILVFACIPQLLVSSSLWVTYSFWLWLAILGNVNCSSCRISNYTAQNNQKIFS